MAPPVNQVHQVNYVGPCSLRGPVRAVEPVASRAGQATADALWATWHRLGVPAHVQGDSETGFYGSPAHPRGMGLLIRRCLGQGIEP